MQIADVGSTNARDDVSDGSRAIRLAGLYFLLRRWSEMQIIHRSFILTTETTLHLESDYLPAVGKSYWYEPRLRTPGERTRRFNFPPIIAKVPEFLHLKGSSRLRSHILTSLF